MSHRYNIYIAKTYVDSVYVQEAFAKLCMHHGVTVSLCAHFLKEVKGQAEMYFGVAMGMSNVTIIRHAGNYWDIAVQHATYRKNRLPSSFLGDRSPYEDMTLAKQMCHRHEHITNPF